MAATYIGTHNDASRMSVAVSTNWRERAVEIFWFSVCLVLFMILGPFAAPIAVCFMFSNKALGDDAREPESLCQSQSYTKR